MAMIHICAPSGSFGKVVHCGIPSADAPSRWFSAARLASGSEIAPGTGQTRRAVLLGIPIAIEPKTQVGIPADATAQAKVKLHVQQGGERTATTTCTLKRDTMVEALPNGPNDSLLLAMRVGKMGCDHVDARFSRY